MSSTVPSVPPVIGVGRVHRPLEVLGAIFALGMIGGTLPVPLYGLWAPQLHFGALTTTLIFASYAVGTMIALLTLAGLSDQAGRRPLLLLGLALAAVSTVVFATADSVPALMAARALSGMAVGVLTATATAALAELDHSGGGRAATAATLANMGGLGLGPMVAGVLAAVVAAPLQTTFWVYLAALGLAAIAVLALPETVAVRRRPQLTLRRPVLPRPEQRPGFIRVAVHGFLAFAVLGLFSSLVPSFLRDVLHERQLPVIGLIVGAVFLIAAAAQIVLGTSAPRLAGRGAILLVLGLGAVEAGLWLGSLPVFVTGALLSGTGVGLTFTAGSAAVQRMARAEERAGLNATFFLAAYAGLTVPAISLGALADTVGPRTATLVVAVPLVAAALATMVAERRDR